MATNYRRVLAGRKEHLFPVVPDAYHGRVVQDLWTMCERLPSFTANVRLMNGLRFLVKYEPYNFVSLLEGRYDPYHVRGWGMKSFSDFEKGRKKLLPRMDDYFDRKGYMNGAVN